MRQVRSFFISQMKSWMLREVKSFALNLTVSNGRVQTQMSVCQISKSWPFLLFLGNPPSPMGGTSWPELPPNATFKQNSFHENVLLNNGPSCWPCPFQHIIVRISFFLPFFFWTALSQCSVSPGYWGNISWMISAGFPMAMASLSFPAPLNLLIVSLLFKPAWSNFPKHPISKCTEGTGSIIN